MTERDEQPDKQAAALGRLRDALDAHSIRSTIEWTPVWGSSTEHPQLHEWRVPHLRLAYALGVPNRIIAPSWQPVYMWGQVLWPVGDPNGMARVIAERYAEICQT